VGRGRPEWQIQGLHVPLEGSSVILVEGRQKPVRLRRRVSQEALPERGQLRNAQPALSARKMTVAPSYTTSAPKEQLLTGAAVFMRSLRR
jgi:hypothetical protein